MKNSCFWTSLQKRNIVRKKLQKFGYSASLRILRGGTSIKSNGWGPFDNKFFFEKKSHIAEKIEKGSL